MQPCLNGGQCLPFGEHSFVCQCPPGFTGPTCATPLSPCAGEANPCANGATCQPVGVFDFLCRCPEGWTGRFCDRLDSRQCQNGGVRTEEGSCLCPSGFEGTSCELKTAPKKKICGQGFEGKGCESKKPEKCDAKLVCRNGGWCEGDVVKCNCPRCFSGLDCSLREPGCEESQQLRLISATLAIVVVLVLVLLVLIVFLFRRRTVEQPGLETVAVAKKEQKIYSTSSDYASRYGADPCERAPTQRLREAAAKALGDDPHYAEIDAPSV
uniref:EGF-like domain-containing protein n=1 Tax=Steinernema glaseri TaxID=37863 RepID=A0A1I8AU30_9BILA